jgi:hypothetical protein
VHFEGPKVVEVVVEASMHLGLEQTVALQDVDVPYLAETAAVVHI